MSAPVQSRRPGLRRRPPAGVQRCEPSWRRWGEVEGDSCRGQVDREKTKSATEAKHVTESQGRRLSLALWAEWPTRPLSALVRVALPPGSASGLRALLPVESTMAQREKVTIATPIRSRRCIVVDGRSGWSAARSRLLEAAPASPLGTRCRLQAHGGSGRRHSPRPKQEAIQRTQPPAVHVHTRGAAVVQE
jgi:hypothetical protein